MKGTNEIEIRRRTLENYTHEVIEDAKLKRITSWRKSQSKYLKNLFYNIVSFYFILNYILNYIVTLHLHQNVIIF